ncbi:carboxylating nicotinate-nucleotide diphosphorylase [Halobacillus sp. ACCC02827]|uniref:carboxylating nicotinate-nucleotide diphosphorylase n=1 Tax=Halobacillus sp. ACCC02827 TaxID=3052090 RepID=UPI00257023E4|nr:carboxylating nicotinate-nucleotide diphosphorylase [Halobacillus sp. ACCC02827]WJE16052.1 carboxylating nicotinate-nucleotide diphosphorylase [Halobacillus sp. ACCC02827]
MNRLKLKHCLETFLREDVGDNDWCESLFDQETYGKMIIRSKQTGCFCGGPVITEGFRVLDPSITVEILAAEGEALYPGLDIASIQGPPSALLQGERVILNLIQRMSGIATTTQQAVQKLNSDHTRICDTRKTTPGLRMFEKYAVRTGGGYNHRFGLYDAVMLKDNHIACFGSIKTAVKQLKDRVGHMVKIEVETESAEQVREAVEAGVDCIMFDNRTPEQVAALAGLVPPDIITEASGGITMDTLHTYRNTGVDYLSLGLLTHSYQAVDISANTCTGKEVKR